MPRDYNCLDRMGTIIKEPRWLFTAARVDGTPMTDPSLPFGSLSAVCGDRLEYLFYRLRGPQWTAQHEDSDLEVDVTFAESGKNYTFKRTLGVWRDANDDA